jgi:hypothetical protein
MAPLLLASSLTIIIETSFLALVGYRGVLFFIVCILVNFITNLTLNILLLVLPAWGLTVLLLESVVVIIEWWSLGYFVLDRRGLFLPVLAANMLSFTVGLFLSPLFRLLI